MLHGFRFGVWCIRRFFATFSAEHNLWDGLTVVERQQLGEIVAELERAAATSEGMTLQRARELEGVMAGIAAGDEYAQNTVEYEALTISWLSMVDDTLKWCAQGDSQSLCAVSEEFVTAWDHLQDDPEYRLENMFSFPDLKRELTLQAAFLSQP
jgi:hypothetical protein